MDSCKKEVFAGNTLQHITLEWQISLCMNQKSVLKLHLAVKFHCIGYMEAMARINYVYAGNSSLFLIIKNRQLALFNCICMIKKNFLGLPIRSRWSACFKCSMYSIYSCIPCIFIYGQEWLLYVAMTIVLSVKLFPWREVCFKATALSCASSNSIICNLLHVDKMKMSPSLWSRTKAPGIVT